jgi:AcrR family transcriptional regulator
MVKKLNGDDRREQLLKAAVRLSARGSYLKITRAEIATDAGCTTNLVTHYFGTVIQLRRAIMRRAIADNNLSVVAQGLAARDPHARKAPDELKQAALRSLAA